MICSIEYDKAGIPLKMGYSTWEGIAFMLRRIIGIAFEID